ncbi:MULTISPECIES: DUF4328 domain-containing protein [Streptomyces]|uniref:DUF4328 domain-containing protein n=1 Tax=Streptomyces TaxID=1883 RepID=UPI0031D3798B
MGPDGRCAACGAYQQQAPAPYPYPGVPGVPGMPRVGGVDLRRGLRIALTVLLSAMMLVLVFDIAAAGKERSACEELLRTGSLDEAGRQALEDADAFATGVGIVHFVLFAATAAVWAVWFRRMRVNAEIFAPGTHRFGTGWAAGAWFTPVVNLWFPKQIANDLYRASSPAGPQAAPRTLLNWWWVLWVTSFGVDAVSTVFDRAATVKLRGLDHGSWRDGVELMKTSLVLDAFSSLLLLAAAPLAILVVRQLTRMQEQRALVHAPHPPHPPFPPTSYGPYGAGPAAS